MSTLLDEETIILEGLDFDVPCNQGDHPAEVMVRCRICKAGTMLCRAHAETVRDVLESAFASGVVAHVVCLGCGKIADSFDSAVEVVPL